MKKRYSQERKRDIEHVRRVAEELKVKWAVADFKDKANLYLRY